MILHDEAMFRPHLMSHSTSLNHYGWTRRSFLNYSNLICSHLPWGLCTCSLPNPHPPPSSKAFSLHNLVGLISFHYLHFMWSISCSRIILDTSSLPVILCHITLSYIFPGLLIISDDHIYIFVYYLSFPISMFYETENVFSWFSILLPENRLSPIPWKVHHAYSLDKGMTEWVGKEIMPLWGLLCTTASKQL